MLACLWQIEHRSGTHNMRCKLASWRTTFTGSFWWLFVPQLHWSTNHLMRSLMFLPNLCTWLSSKRETKQTAAVEFVSLIDFGANISGVLSHAYCKQTVVCIPRHILREVNQSDATLNECKLFSDSHFLSPKQRLSGSFWTWVVSWGDGDE